MAVTAAMAAAAVRVGIAAAEDVITAAGATAAAVGAGAGAVAAVVGACASEVWPFVGDRHPLPDQSEGGAMTRTRTATSKGKEAVRHQLRLPHYRGG